MSQVIAATFVDGVFKPEEIITIPSGTRVRLTWESSGEQGPARQSQCDELDRLCEQFPIESRGRRLTRDELHDRN